MAYHGILTKRESTGVRPIDIVSPSIIGVVGTAPSAVVDGKFGDGTKPKYNETFYITSREEAVDLGDDGSLPVALNGIFRQGQMGCHMVIVEEKDSTVQVAAKDLAVETFSTITTKTALDAAATLTGAHWALLTESSKKYLAFKNPAGADDTLLGAVAVGQKITIAASGGSVLKTYVAAGTYDSTNKWIEVDSNADTSTLTNSTTYDLQIAAIAAADGDELTRANLAGTEADGTGVYALLAADPVPKILCVGSEFANTRVGGSANVVAAALVEVAQKLRAIAVLDGPSTSNTDAKAFAGDFDSAAAYLVDPGIITADGEVTASPSVAGLIAANDVRNGYWTSPSNQVLNGALGLRRAVSHGFSGSQADDLNTNHIAALIQDSGIRLWGNETLADTDPTYRFLPVARVANSIEDALQRSLKWAIDQNITSRLLENIAQSVNGFLAKLTAQGAITGGECYPDSTKNTVANVKGGEVYFNIEWSGSYPAQTLNLTLELSDRFLEAVLAEL